VDRFDGELAAAAQATQPLREGADYDARCMSADDAERVCTLAERFLSAIDDLVADQRGRLGRPPPSRRSERAGGAVAVESGRTSERQESSEELRAPLTALRLYPAASLGARKCLQ
jgi:hypothetical protein